MAKVDEEDTSKQSILLTILLTLLSCVLWTTILIILFNIPIVKWAREEILPFINQPERQSLLINESANIETQTVSTAKDSAKTLIAKDQEILKVIALDTIQQYDYPLFFYPVSQNVRLPMNFPSTKAELPLVDFREVIVAEIVVVPLANLMEAARSAGFSPYLRSGFRSIDDQYTAYSKYVTEATAAGKDLTEARDYANRFSAMPGYSEHHLGLTVDLLDYFYRDWIVARNNYDKGLYLWLRQHAHEYGFVISYPAGDDKLNAKPGSGYTLSEPWHLRFVGEDLAFWLFDNGYLDPRVDITVNGVLLDIARLVNESG
jgi:LAS superfamily LD-carboxypeptidase LdcB